MSKNNISFILHKPQLSENIGACARAIKNFDFKKLILIKIILLSWVMNTEAQDGIG